MRSTTPVPMSHHGVHTSYVPRSLSQASLVYVRHDAHRLPLQRPYDVPFKVLKKDQKFFTVEKNGAPYTVSVDRLKPADTSYTPLPRPVPSPVSRLAPAVSPTLDLSLE